MIEYNLITKDKDNNILTKDELVSKVIINEAYSIAVEQIRERVKISTRDVCLKK